MYGVNVIVLQGCNRYVKKISQNKSLLFLAKLKGGQQFLRFIVAVGAVFRTA